MSRFMQIDVNLLPEYGAGGLAGAFPKLASFLRDCGRSRLVEQEFSLYHLVDPLKRIGLDPAVADSQKAGLRRLLPRLQQVRDEAREHLLGYRLQDLDRCLYRLEDLFGDLEKELQW